MLEASSAIIVGWIEFQCIPELLVTLYDFLNPKHGLFAQFRPKPKHCPCIITGEVALIGDEFTKMLVHPQETLYFGDIWGEWKLASQCQTSSVGLLGDQILTKNLIEDRQNSHLLFLKSKVAARSRVQTCEHLWKFSQFNMVYRCLN